MTAFFRSKLSKKSHGALEAILRGNAAFAIVTVGLLLALPRFSVVEAQPPTDPGAAAAPTATASTAAPSASAAFTQQLTNLPSGVGYYDRRLGDGAVVGPNDEVAWRAAYTYLHTGTFPDQALEEKLAAELGGRPINTSIIKDFSHPAYRDGAVGMRENGVRVVALDNLLAPKSVREAWESRGQHFPTDSRTVVMFEVVRRVGASATTRVLPDTAPTVAASSPTSTSAEASAGTSTLAPRVYPLIARLQSGVTYYDVRPGSGRAFTPEDTIQYRMASEAVPSFPDDALEERLLSTLAKQQIKTVEPKNFGEPKMLEGVPGMREGGIRIVALENTLMPYVNRAYYKRNTGQEFPSEGLSVVIVEVVAIRSK